MKIFLKWLATVAIFSLVVSIIWPFFVHSRRPARQTFHITKTYARSADVKSAFDVSGMTQQRVVAEGPCEGNGCQGGVLSQQFLFDVQSIIPDLEGYNGKTTTLIWLYQVEPISATRHNDSFGDDTLTVRGKQTKDRKIYFALVPTYLTAPGLQWIYVETQ